MYYMLCLWVGVYDVTRLIVEWEWSDVVTVAMKNITSLIMLTVIDLDQVNDDVNEWHTLGYIPM